MFPENSNESKLFIYPVEVRLCFYQDCFLSLVFSCTSTSNSDYGEYIDIGAHTGHSGLTGSLADTELTITELRGT